MIILIEYIPLQQGLRRITFCVHVIKFLIEYIPLQQGLRLISDGHIGLRTILIEYIPLQQGLRPMLQSSSLTAVLASLSIFHYNKD